MYNLSGLEYRLFAVGMISLVCGLICFLFSRLFKNKKALKVKEHINRDALILGVLFIFISIVYSGYYIFKIQKPDISVHEGIFIEERRNSRVAPPLPFTMQYTFTNNNNPNSRFYLDVFSKPEIYDKEFERGSKYRIYYEKDTDIILKAEKIE